MKSLIWKWRFARHMYRKLAGDCYADWKLAWGAACTVWVDCDGGNYDPIESADEELTYWSE